MPLLSHGSPQNAEKIDGIKGLADDGVRVIFCCNTGELKNPLRRSGEVALAQYQTQYHTAIDAITFSEEPCDGLPAYPAENRPMCRMNQLKLADLPETVQFAISAPREAKASSL